MDFRRIINTTTTTATRTKTTIIAIIAIAAPLRIGEGVAIGAVGVGVDVSEVVGVEVAAGVEVLVGELVGVVVATELTVIAWLVPFTAEKNESEAVIVCEPLVLSVTLKTPVPLTNLVRPPVSGKTAAASVEEKAIVPPYPWLPMIVSRLFDES